MLKIFLYFLSALFAAKVIFILAAWPTWGLDIEWNGWVMPVWLVILALVVDAALAWKAFHFARKIK